MIRDALRNGTAIEFSDITNSELLRRLSEQRVTLRAQLAEQSSTLLDQHPRIKELRAQINDLERQLRTEGDRLVRSLENDAKLAGSRVEGLGASLDQLKRAAASTNEQDVQLRALERDAKSQRDLLESYLAKFHEATARDNIVRRRPTRASSRARLSRTRRPGRRSCPPCCCRRSQCSSSRSASC
jgi:polysaccharide biosynthesis transport protein